MAQEPAATPWLSTAGAANMLDLSPERVRQLVKKGVLSAQASPLGRLFERDAVAALTAARERERAAAASRRAAR